MTCPRTIFLKNGKQRTVRCRSWNCDNCATIRRRFITRAIAESFAPELSLAVRIRAREEGHHDSLTKVWHRLRARLPGIRYLAVQEPDPDGHLHALITHIDALSIREHAMAAAAYDVDVEPCRDIGDFTNYLLDKRQDRRAPRIMHSRDLTKILHERIHNVSEAEKEKTLPDDEARRSQAQEAEQTAHAEPAPITPQITSERPTSTGDPLPRPDDEQRRPALVSLIEAARATGREYGCAVAFTFTVNP